jgi:N6-L-threonylcarbamoyladenine synthase
MSAPAILAIETSCDETAAAVVTDASQVLSSVVSSQIDLHARFGGVVPEIAGRAHVELLEPVVAEALERAQRSTTDPRISAVAVTRGPGLVGSLLVGLSGAKAMALAWGVPLVGVNHLEGHLFAAQLEAEPVGHPHVTLLVSGGHTMLIGVDAPGRYRMLGSTIDDAAGEAYDKVARYLGLGYPGGPAIDALAAEGDPTAIRFPRAMAGDSLDFSFSGIKTSVVRCVQREPDWPVADVAASFQAAVVEVLVTKAMRAVELIDARALVLGGGVAANSSLRAEATRAADEAGVRCALPSMAMCTDNAAMIGAAGWHRLGAFGGSGLELGADPSLALELEEAS